MIDGLGVILAGGGVGRRFGGQTYKQFVELGGRPIYHWSLETFLSMPLVQEVVAVVPEGHEESFTAGTAHISNSGKMVVVPGGRTRQMSVENGLRALSSDLQWVAVHDAARPLVTPELVESTFLMALEAGAAVPSVPIPDTVKEVDDSSLVVRTLDRTRLRLAQTPQICRRKELEQAMAWAKEKGIEATDEASLLEAFGISVAIVEGSRFNLKVTTQEDLAIAQGIVAQMEAPER